MRSFIFGFVVVAMLTAFTAAFAADESVTLDVCDAGCCEFTCVLIDVECCGWCNGENPLKVEFLGFDGAVLGTAVIEDDWCGGCYDEHFATLDAPVASQDICSVRVTKGMDDCCSIDWMCIKGLCDLGCCKTKWNKIWKGDVWCWTPV